MEACNEISECIKNETAGGITEIDLSHNMIADLSPLGHFTDLQQLILDYNYVKALDSLPIMPTLKVLSLSYNQLNNREHLTVKLAAKCPALEHLNLMKNPCNPVFSNQGEYKLFRAKFSIWIPTLKTLDGPDFKDDQEMITKIKGLENAKR